MSKILLLLSLTLISVSHAQTVGWFFSNPGAADGYVLFAPGNSDTTFLIDKCGKRIHEWGSHYDAGLAVYLQNGGNILRCGHVTNNQFSNGGGQGGIIEKIDWNSNVLWSYKISDNTQCQHHDAIQLPNGNIVALVWESHTKTDAQASGRVSMGNEMWSEKIVEVQPFGADSGIIVWQWRAWDHLIQDVDSNKINYGVVAGHPELLNINLGVLNSMMVDWLHFNALDYDAAHDQIMVNSRLMSEVYLIDHSTTTAEAASHSGGTSGHGGDLLYRWGNPENYGRGGNSDQRLYEEHNPSWIPQGYPGAGKVLVFNNGVGRPGGNYTTIETFTIPEMVNNNYPLEPDSAYDPDVQDWIFTATPANSLYSFVEGGAQRLYNGNTLICEAVSGRFIEIDSLGNVLWQYINPVGLTGNTQQGNQPFLNDCFRATYLRSDDPRLSGQTLIPGGTIELNPLNYSCTDYPTAVNETATDNESILSYPNPFEGTFTLQLPSQVSHGTLRIHDMLGKVIFEKAITTNVGQTISLPGIKGVLMVTFRDDSGCILQSTIIAE